MKKQQVPCYLRNGGKQQIVNVPLGIFTRLELKKLCEELLHRQKTLQTFVAAEATPRCLTLLQGLTKILSLDLKPKAVRRKAECWYAAHEKNLKQKQLQLEEGEVVNLVHAAISFGLIALMFLIAAYWECQEWAQY